MQGFLSPAAARRLVSMLGALALVLSVASTPAFAQEGSDKSAKASQDNGAAIEVGTFKARQVFRAYAGRQAMMQEMQKARQAAQKARQNGDRQAAMKAARDMQKKRKQVMGKFQDRMGQAVEKVAKEAGVDLVTTRVEFKSDKVETVDLTKKVTAALNKMVPESEKSQGPSRMQKLKERMQQKQKQGKQAGEKGKDKAGKMKDKAKDKSEKGGGGY